MKQVRLHDKRANEDLHFNCFEDVKCDLPEPKNGEKRKVSISRGGVVKKKTHFTGHG